MRKNTAGRKATKVMRFFVPVLALLPVVSGESESEYQRLKTFDGD